MENALHYALTLIHTLVDTHPFWRGEKSRETVLADIEQVIADLANANADSKKSDAPVSVVK